MKGLWKLKDVERMLFVTRRVWYSAAMDRTIVRYTLSWFFWVLLGINILILILYILGVK